MSIQTRLVLGAVILLLITLSAGSRSSAAVPVIPVGFTINAAQEVYSFNPKMRGVAMNNWNWIWGGFIDPNAPKRHALIELTQYIKPGIIRFAGGLWANRVGWDRNDIAPDDGPWTDPASGKQYTHAYKPAMIDSYAAFAADVGAETMMQCNISDNNPAMWTDLVRYCNQDHNYAFKYWELGNELELPPGAVSVPENLGVPYDQGPREYGNRFASYRTSMRQVDSRIKVMGPVPHQPYRAQDWFKPVFDRVAQLGQSVDALSWHSYPLTEWTSNPSAGWAYNGGSVEALLAFNEVVGNVSISGMAPGETVPADMSSDLNTYRRQCAEAIMSFIRTNLRPTYPVFETAITEFGPHAWMHEHPINSNHIAAIWLADMLGRYAYNGLDMITYYSLEDGGTGLGNSRGLVGTDDNRYLDVRAIYYTEFLYAQFFGDRMVRSSTSDASQKVVVWASKDTAEPGSLKLMMINLTGDTAVSDIDVSGFTPAAGFAYEMTSANPMSLSNPASFTQHQTTINGTAIPDYDVQNPATWRNAVASIASMSVPVSQNFSYSLPPYSVVALVLKDSAGAPPPQIGPNAPLPPMPPPPPPGPTPAPAPAGDSGGTSGGRCGLLGMEAVLVLALLARRKSLEN
ncbi:MAG: hypothetical protein HYY16_03570 [Planctomycetes bacterium]|nr:hypothetical protein [Planctomycetota bacterium]